LQRLAIANLVLNIRWRLQLNHSCHNSILRRG
jgi:hypothetical protein